MKLSIKNAIYQAIIKEQWLEIHYVNKNNEPTNYYIAIKDIDPKNGKLFCEIFNVYKSNQSLDKEVVYIYIDRIKKADVLENTYYDVPQELLKKVNNDLTIINYLDVANFDNNILRYLSDCYRLDDDPFLKDIVMIDGIDNHTLLEKAKYKLDDKQFYVLLDRVFKKPSYEAERINRYQTLAINRFSIDLYDKQYVVAYRTLSLNFKDKTLKVSKKSSINKSFLISEGKKVTLSMYLEMDSKVFCESFDSKSEDYIEEIKSNFRNGEKVNTRPTIFFLMRNSRFGVEEAFEAINEMDQENKLTFPLKSFFGRNRPLRGTSKEVNLVIFNHQKININQMRVVYNSMVNHVTYVKGPPGTGKTETIFNVILSAYANNKSVLICSNNNHPISDIYRKMDNSLTIKRPYSNDVEKVYFPMIRFGNNEEMAKAIIKLREILSFVSKNERSKVQEELTEMSKNRSLSNFKELRDLLIEFEQRLEREEYLDKMLKTRNLMDNDKMAAELDFQIKQVKAELNQFKLIQDEDVLKYAISASIDKNFQNYIYYSTLLKFKKLTTEPYRELRDIICLSDLDEAVQKLNKYLKDDSNLKKVIAIFPIIICTNQSSDKLGSAKPQFDLVIMDEAGQCNIATSLIPIVRGNNLLLVGDTNQLQPVTVIEDNINEDLISKYNVGEEYDYIHNSILSTMLRKDNNSKNILLDCHYRCGRKIAGFSNKRFYGGELKLLNKNLGELLYYNVNNSSTPPLRNSSKEEAYQIVKIIKENNYKDVGIVTPFKNQAYLINDYLERAGIKDCKAGTIHTLQGSEKSIIIMSAALSLKTIKRTMDWIKNNHEVINVGITRAKDKFIFVGDKSAIDKLSGKEINDIKSLSDYVYSNGNIQISQSDAIISYDFSNDSKNEKEFFETIKPYFNRRGTKFRISRNVPVKEAISNIMVEDYRLIGKKEFDVIVQVKRVFRKKYVTIVAFEIDGGEHVGSKRQAYLDRQKELVCKRYGIKLIRIPNSAVKDYETIINIFQFAIKDLNTIDDSSHQISLFDEE